MLSLPAYPNLASSYVIDDYLLEIVLPGLTDEVNVGLSELDQIV
jgi:hypothetical protein